MPRPTQVLVVDDEPLMGRTVRRTLGAQHEVTCFTSARLALEELLSGKTYDVVVCDLMMPEMTGMDLYAALQRAAPAVVPRMIFLTGGAFTASAREFLARMPNLCIEKPFEPAQLKTAVQRMAEQSRGDAAFPAGAPGAASPPGERTNAIQGLG
ncbi:MAG: response regulator [Myxococcota bacterium]